MDRLSKINDVDEYNDLAIDVFEDFLRSFTEEEGLIRKPTEAEISEFELSEGSFVYTVRGSRLAEKMSDRLHALGAKLFPDDEFDVDVTTIMFREY